MEKAAVAIAKTVPNGIPTEVIPPGTCLHFYRNGLGYSAAYTPCIFFEEIEYVPSLLDDHCCDTGYHRALLTTLRDLKNDLNAVFANELYAR
jgi:hypothetical protein